MRVGLPRVITSDQGSEFNNSLDTELMEMRGVEHKRKEQWEDYLDTCIYAYNTSKHESSKYTPFEVMFGRQAVLPVDTLN